MMDFLRRWIPGLEQQAVPAPRRRKKKHKSVAYDPALSVPPPVADVVASDDENTDWAMWEDSVNQVDSQLQSLSPMERRQLRGATASRYDELVPGKADPRDVFAGVGKNREV